jgi:hypothetical protein
VRWWATDEAFWKCLDEPCDEYFVRAGQRLATINRFYTVYLDLILVDVEGRVVAVSNESHKDLVGRSVSGEHWVEASLRTQSGDDYIVDDIHASPLHRNAPVAIYSAAVRRGGDNHGAPLGVLGAFFDWGPQAKTIVEDEPNLNADDWARTTVYLLDSTHLIIASSNNQDFLQTFPLRHEGRSKGHYVDDRNQHVVFAKTIGYEEYDGLRWYGVIVQRSRN